MLAMPIDLNQGWKLLEANPGQGIKEKWFNFGPVWEKAISVPVPGDVQQALQKTGRLPEPFFAKNPQQYTWVEQREWWYGCKFFLPPELITTVKKQNNYWQLKFNGLDTLCTIWLNGQKLGKSENMFLPFCSEVSKSLVSGENFLTVCFPPLTPWLEKQDASKYWAVFYKPRVLIRKAQMNFSWDWGPRLVTTGIWRAVALNIIPKVNIIDFYFQTKKIEKNQAAIQVDITLDGEKETLKQCQLQLWLLEDKKTILEQNQAVKKNKLTFNLLLDKPRLWWTFDWGEPYLYTLKLILKQNNKIISSLEQKVGIRTISLLQEADKNNKGKSFTFVLNGQKIFARGANWIPADSFLGRIKPARYKKWIKKAREANMNMLRIWGGGIYEDASFYKACDENGILVWQDFMFACAAYPDDDSKFLNSVKKEAEWVIKELRNHPCLAIWCGNNECQWIDERWHWDKKEHRFYGQKIFTELLPQLCSQLDPNTFYWPSSPYGGNDYNSEEEGDRHHWTAWAGLTLRRRFGEPWAKKVHKDIISFNNYLKDSGRFISEYGLHGAPERRTLEENLNPNERYFPSSELIYHNCIVDMERDKKLVLYYTGPFKNWDEFLLFSALTQAEGLRIGIEHFRRNKFHCSGSLIWQFNDCWPALSWSLVDYYLRPKASFYAIKKAYHPLLLSFSEKRGHIYLYGINDLLTEQAGTLTVTLSYFNGEVIWSESQRVFLPVNQAIVINKWLRKDIKDPKKVFLSALLKLETGEEIRQQHYFCILREQFLPQAKLVVDYGDNYISLGSEKLIRYVNLQIEKDGFFPEDNYFDLVPGEIRKIMFNQPLTQAGKINISALNLNANWEPR